MKIECELKGAKELDNKLNKLYLNLLKGMKKGVEDMAKNTQDKAKDIAPIDKAGRGLIKNSILIKNEENNNYFVSKVYVDSSLCPFVYYVYFGTGLYGKGKRRTEWIVKESTLQYSTPELMDMYFNTYQLKSGEKYWVVRGQKPQPFLEDAMNVSLNENKDIFKNAVREYLRRV